MVNNIYFVRGFVLSGVGFYLRVYLIVDWLKFVFLCIMWGNMSNFIVGYVLKSNLSKRK